MSAATFSTEGITHMFPNLCVRQQAWAVTHDYTVYFVECEEFEKDMSGA